MENLIVESNSSLTPPRLIGVAPLFAKRGEESAGWLTRGESKNGNCKIQHSKVWTT
jgi:hypothetical protein